MGTKSMKDHEGLWKAKNKGHPKVKLWLLKENYYQHLLGSRWDNKGAKGEHSNLERWFKEGKKKNEFFRVGPVEVGKW